MGRRAFWRSLALVARHQLPNHLRRAEGHCSAAPAENFLSFKNLAIFQNDQMEFFWQIMRQR
jgi:hypothetical protein